MRHPSAAWRAAAVALAVLFSPACLVLSLQPAYDAASVVFEEGLLGRWENREDQSRLLVERGEWRSYRIAFTERGSTRTLNGNLTAIGDQPILYVDVTELRGADPGPYVIPVHGLYRVTFTGDGLTAAPLDLDWFTQAAAERRRAAPALALDDRRNVIVTASTAEFRRWLARAPEAAFAAPMTFQRVDR